ncbi:putative zinc protease y4wA [Nymphon striatum]|nr:putative zinc protease y4wA [Nymphon striatum]
MLRDQLGEKLIEQSGADFDAPIINLAPEVARSATKAVEQGRKQARKSGNKQKRGTIFLLATGALGLEAISRGSEYCVFIEEASSARGAIRENVEALQLSGITKIFRRDATRLGNIGTLKPFDLVFADPPYRKGFGEKAARALREGGWLNQDALFILEEATDHFPESLKGYDWSIRETAVSAIGGQENAFTSWDYTAYYQKVAPSALPDMMKYEADRMRNLVVTEDVFLPERDVVLEERSGRVDRSPSAILSEFSRAALHTNHPYSIPIIGWEHEIATLKMEDALAFYERWYQPWNAIIVVAERKWTSSPANVVAQNLVYKDERVTQPSWQRMFRVPSYQIAEEGEAEALDLLSTIMGGSATSRIQKEIVLEQELATAAGAFYQGSSRDMSSFGFYAVPRGGHQFG